MRVLIVAAFAVAVLGCSPPEQAPPAPAPTIEGLSAVQARAEAGPVRIIARLREDAAATPAVLQFNRAAVVDELHDRGVPSAAPLSETWPLIVAEVSLDDLNRMVETGRIAAVQEDELAFTSLAQSVPLIGGPAIFAEGARGAGQAVAILDTGVDAAHPFFGGRVVAEACFSSNAPAQGGRTVCPNGQNTQTGPGAAAPCAAGGCEHGTHVAGIAAGNGAAFTGVAPDADIIAVQVFTQFTDQPGGPSPCAGSGQRSPCMASFTSDQIRGLDFVLTQAAARRVAAANMSLGGGRSAVACDSDVTKGVIDALLNAGVATVIAAGNNGFPDAVSRPGCISSAITVGATTKQDGVASFSNRGPLLDLHAPGASINSSVTGGRFAVFNGTSMAAPHVAGAFAALRSARPEATVADIERALEENGVLIAGAPRIALPAALAALAAAGTTAMAEPAQTSPDLTAALAAVAALPADRPVRVIARPATTLDALEVAARNAGATDVQRMGAQPMLVIEATPAQLQAIARTGAMAAMQTDDLARPQ